MNTNKTEILYLKQNSAPLNGKPLKLVDHFTFLGCSISSTKRDFTIHIQKAWTAIDKLLNIWKSDLSDILKQEFFQAVAVLVLLYGCTTWTLTKHTEKKPDGDYTRILEAVLNKSWKQHLTKQQLYGHLPLISETIQVRRTRHTWRYWGSRDELISDVLL